MILHRTEAFEFHLMRVGAALVRTKDNASVYFQPGDVADRVIEDVEHLSKVAEMYPGENERVFNYWANQYFN